MPTFNAGESFKKQLANGLTILVHPIKTIPKVTTQLWYHSGSKEEKSGQRGLAHLLEHMLFKGTSKLSESDISLITHKLSGYCNAFTSYDYTAYLFDFPRQHWPVSLDILADCMRNATLKPDLLNAELKAVVQELKMYRDDYATTLIEELIGIIFSDHPYHYPIIGKKQDIWSITPASLNSFYKQHYIPNNATLFVVGDVEPENVFELAQAAFGAIEKDASFKKNRTFHNADISAQQITIYRDVAQPMVMMAWVTQGIKEKQCYYWDVISWLLGTGKGAPLYKKIVDELQLASDFEAFNYELVDYSLFVINFQPIKQEDISKIVQLVHEQIATFINDIPDNQIIRAIKKVEMDHLSISENMQRFAYAWGESYIATGDEYYLFNYVDTDVARVKSTVKQFLKEYLRPAITHMGTILPLPASEKKYWLSMQENSDEQDEVALQTKQRESLIEEALLSKEIQVKDPIEFNFPEYKKITLDNELTVLWSDHPGIPKIEIILTFKAQSYFDPENKQGLFNFVTEAMLEGTKNYPGHTFVDELDSYGMQLSVSPGVMTLTVLSKDFEKGLQLLLEILTNATFEESAIEKVREQIICEIDNYWDSPTECADQLMREQIYQGHPYCKMLLGNKKSIKSIKQKDLIEFYQKYISPCSGMIAFVGDLKGYDVAQVVKNNLSQWPLAHVEDITFPELKPIKKHLVKHEMNRDQIVLSIAGISTTRFNPNYDPLLLFDQIFTGGVLGSMNSKLFDLREQTGLFYTIGGTLVARVDEQPGMAIIKTIVSRDQLFNAQQLLYNAIKYAMEGVTEEDLEMARRALINALLDNFESNAQIAEAILFLERFGLTPDYFKNRWQQLKNVTMQDVKRAVEEVLDVNKMITLHVGRVD